MSSPASDCLISNSDVAAESVYEISTDLRDISKGRTEESKFSTCSNN